MRATRKTNLKDGLYEYIFQVLPAKIWSLGYNLVYDFFQGKHLDRRYFARFGIICTIWSHLQKKSLMEKRIFCNG